MSLYIEQEYTLPLEFDLSQVADQVVKAVAEEEQCPYDCEINLILTDDAGIQKLNLEHRGLDKPTDVLSFPLLTPEDHKDYALLEARQEDFFNPETGELVLGDIVLSLDRVAEQAEAYGHSAMREYAFLIAHSMLHLFGYDHMTPKEAASMENKQRKILDRLGIKR